MVFRPNGCSPGEVVCLSKNNITIYSMNRNEIHKLIRSIKRIPFPIYSEIAKKVDLPKLLTKNKIFGEKDTHSDKLGKLLMSTEQDFTHIFDFFKEAYLDNLLFGSKYIRYFKPSQSEFDELFQIAKILRPDNNNIVSEFPYMLQPNDVKEKPVNEIYLAKSLLSENSLMLIYTKVVDYEERVSIDASNINIEDREFYNGFYGIKRYKKQFVNIVYFDISNRRIEFRIDFFNEDTESKAKKYYNEFYRLFKAKMGYNAGATFLDLSYNNIFKVIQKVYADSQGRLVDIGFTTMEGSNYKIKKRRQQEDIREETYHKGGEKAVSGHLDIYRIGMCWAQSGYKNIELLIPGSSRLIHSEKYITEAVITNCRGSADFNFVNNKIYNYLGQGESI